MLQQTRVSVVAPYYRRFMRRFPRVKALARSRLEAVLACWSGLGYYRRARHLHAAARKIVLLGKFPRSSAELLQLPGIGRYTAGAIASIAFAEPVSAVDGNAERVLSRLAGWRLTHSDAWKVATHVLSRRRPGDFNQAIMELGALICTPRTPQCSLCPVAGFCGTRGEQRAHKPAPRSRRSVAYLVAEKSGRLLMVRRSAGAGVMAGMWEFPEAEPAFIGAHGPDLRLRHAIMNTDYEVAVYRAASASSLDSAGVPEGACWISKRRLPQLPLTGLARKIMRAMEGANQQAHAANRADEELKRLCLPALTN